MSSLNRVMRLSVWGAVALAGGVSLAGCGGWDSGARADDAPVIPETAAAPLAAPQVELVSSQRTGRLRSYPCSTCHETIGAAQSVEQVDATAAPRSTGGYAAGHHGLHFQHFAAIEQCGVCHDPTDMDGLRLLDGTHTSFDAAEGVCGQCHGEKLRDFEIGAHGKLMGGFRGVKYRYVCTDCHDPHAPRRPKVTALPAPPFPELGIPKGQH